LATDCLQRLQGARRYDICLTTFRFDPNFYLYKLDHIALWVKEQEETQ